MKTRRNIAIVYSNAGSGYRSAAAAIQKVLQKRQPFCEVRLVNITDVFDFHPLFGKFVRAGINSYNRQLRRDQPFGLGLQMKGALLAHNLVSDKGIQQMADYWNSFKPDVVVSVTPLFNAALYRSAMEMNPAVQCVTIPIAFEEAHRKYWFTPKVMQYYLNATQQLNRQAVKAGVPEKHAFRIDGLPVEASAYEPAPTNRNEQLRAIGLNPEWPVGYVSFGGQSTSKALSVVKDLAKQHQQLNLIILCGQNKSLFTQLNKLKLPFPAAIYTYLPNTPIHLLHLADFAIGKPGAITISEAVITHTPLIVLKSKGMRAVHKGNEAWLTESACGVVAATPDKVASAVTAILSNGNYTDRMIENKHQGVFQIAAWIEEIGKLNHEVQVPWQQQVLA